MRLRVMHIGDIHLHEPLGREEQQRYLDAIIDQVDRTPVDLVLVAGDLVRPASADRASIWERQTLLRFFLGLTVLGARVIVLRGNHDLPGDWAWLNAVPGLEYYEEPCETAVVIDDVTGTSVRVFLLPWPDPSGPLGRGGDLMDVLREQLDEWRELAAGEPALLAMHAATRGVTKADGQPLVLDEVEIPTDALTGFTLVCASHIHAAQQEVLEDGTVLSHAGSPWPHRSDEGAQQGKGPDIWELLWTADGWAAKHAGKLHVPYAPRYTYRLAWDDERKLLAWPDGTPWDGLPDDGLNGSRPPIVPQRSTVAGARVRVAVRRPTTASKAIDRDGIVSAFLGAGALECAVDVSTVHLDRPRCPEIAQPKLSLWERIQIMRTTEARPIAPAEVDAYRTEVGHLQQTIDVRAAQARRAV